MLKNKHNLSWILLVVLVLTLFGVTVSFTLDVTKLKDATDNLNQIEFISSSTQRLIKLTLEDREKDVEKIAFDIDTSLLDLQHDSQRDKVFANDEDFALLVQDVIKDWDTIKDILADFEDIDTSRLYFAGERHFFHANNLSYSVSDYANMLSSSIIQSEIFLMVLVICIALVAARIFMGVQEELRRNKAITRSMFVDTATGLFDRSKCQELFKNMDIMAEQKSKALFVLDLNDLKKTNDLYGHKTGDELIAGFAKLLKDATKVIHSEPFVGRYGGDEFIVYYSNIDKDETSVYLNELARLAHKYNEAENRFQISYAVGLAVSDPHAGSLSFRALFDEADKAMYTNKVEVKHRKRES